MYKFLLLFLIFIAGCANQKQVKHKYLLYIGTYTDSGSEGIYISEFDSITGTLSKPVLAASIKNPSFQYINKDKSLLWSVSEAEDGTGLVCGFKIDQSTGKLNQQSIFSTKGNGPCYVSMDETHNILLAANYRSGSIFGISVNEKGEATDSAITDLHRGAGPNPDRQKGPHAHSIRPDLNGKYIYSADLGTDKVYVYTVEAQKLLLYKEIKLQPGSGPRHIDFHPKMKAMAVINELNGTVTLFTPDSSGCFSKYHSTTSTLPDTFEDFNKCADIHFSPSGELLYASNRGHNSIVIYKVDQETLSLKRVGWEQETVNWPRNFTITNSGKYLLVANKDANTVTVFEVDQKTGLLSYTDNSITVDKPVCLNMIKLGNKL